YINKGSVNYTYNVGAISGSDYTGGIVGYTNGNSSTYYNTVSYGYNASTVASTSSGYVGAVIGYGAGSGNTRQYLYYDISVMESFTPPSGRYKPTRAYGPSVDNSLVRSLTKAAMIQSGLSSYSFSNTIWTFCDNDGRWAFYPQLKTFSGCSNTRVVNESKLYVRTIPFTGEGTKASPYILYTLSDVLIVANSINAEYDASDTYYLVSSTVSQFNLASTPGFIGIGKEGMPFNGNIDGNFANFVINISGEANCVGLFGYIGPKGSVTNLSVSGSVTGGNYVGGVAGINEGQLTNVYNTANVKGASYVGGIAGSNTGTISIGYNRGNIEASGEYAGGIAGLNSGAINDVYNGALVLADDKIGGVAGYSDGGTFSKAYYDFTLIYYFSPSQGNKPSRAVSNVSDTSTVTGKESELIRGKNILGGLGFNTATWTETASTGLYDYYPQIKAFASNINSAIAQQSNRSVRVIRFTVGSGTASDPYILRHEDDMKLLSDVSYEENLTGMYFKVADGVTKFDLTDSSLNFRPIGSSAYNFRGIFDGNGAEFELNITSNANNSGLFSYIGAGAVVKNLTVTGRVAGGSNSGGVVANASSATIDRVINKAVVTGNTNVGGVAGYIYTSQLLNSYNLADVTGTGNCIGGVVGFANNLAAVKYVYNFGVISGVSQVGGVVGRVEAKTNIAFCYNTNNVSGTSNYVGGLVGSLANSYLDNGYSAGTVRGISQSYTGGIVGRGDNSAESNCYYDKTIIDADVYSASYKPIRAVANKLDTAILKGTEKGYMTGSGIIYTPESEDSTGQLLRLDNDAWVLKSNNGIDAYYPQLKVFAENETALIKNDSLNSVRSYIFAGKGEEMAPYIILNENDMMKLSELVSLGNAFTGIYFSVRQSAQEFDLTYYEYEPVGTAGKIFDGLFNGNGVNFRIELDTGDYAGLFGYLGENAVVYNLSVTGQVKGANNVGSVAGYSAGTVYNVYSLAKVQGTNNAGGILGYNSGYLRNTYYIGDVSAEMDCAGGLVGYNYIGEISQGYAAAKISAGENAGGVVGYQSGTYKLSYLFYNKTTVEIHDIDPALKPVAAVANVADTDNVCGRILQSMTTGTLGAGESQMNLDKDVWTPLAPFGFDTYYPQIKYFATHSMSKVKTNSKNSVTVNRFTEGDGSENNPYIIRTNFDMKAISDLVTSGKMLEGNFFKVADGVTEIDLTTNDFVYMPIGNSSYYFQGNFDGNGARFIVNVSTTSGYNYGLFGFTGNKAVIRNVSVSGSVSAARFAAGIAGRNRGLIENCYNLASVNVSEYYAGGITGYNEGTIRNCYNTGNVNATTYYYVGGIAGYTVRNTLIEYCYNRGAITAGGYYVGGIAGYSQGKISNTYSAGIVNGLSSGGIIGATDSYATTFYSYYDTTVITVYDGTRKPVRSISNIADSENVKGVVTSQISGDNLYGVTFEEDLFLLKPNDGFDAFYPQLKVFVQSGVNRVKEDSLNSVRTKIFIGEGTESKPFGIINAADMKALAVLQKQGADTNGVYFKVYYSSTLMDLSSAEIAYYPIGTQTYPFEGVFLGNGAVFTMGIDSPSSYIGLFGYIGENGTVSDFRIKGSVTGGEFTGSVAGYNKGTIKNVGSAADVKGFRRAGGLVGVNEGRIENSYSKGSLTATGEYSGGVAGVNSGVIYGTYNFGKVNSSVNYAGGLTGQNQSTGNISYSFNHGEVVTQGQYVGGIAGVNAGTIQIAYNTADVSGNKYAGGLVSTNSGTISNAYHSGQVMAPSNSGGIASANIGTLDRVYYNTSETDRILPDAPYLRITSAVYGMSDSDTVKGLTLDQITGLEAIGPDTMDFDISIWALKEGYDFISYFPELIYFRNHETGTVRDDSLISVTDKKFEGSGTQSDPYLIYDGYDMRTIGEYVVKGNLFKNKYFKVAHDVNVIDLSFYGLNFKPIGDDEMRFGGIIDGQGVNFIVDLDNEDEDYQGIFHTLGSTAKVFNFSVSGMVIGKSYLGAVAGRNLGAIENVTNNATIKSFDGNNVGGITGFNEGSIRYAINYAAVNMRGTYGGGIAGENTGTIGDCYNKGNVDGVTNIGGITGRNFNTIMRCYNTANITSQTQAGGIAGENDYAIEQSFNMGRVKATVAIAGGITGAQRSKGDGTTPSISIVYNTGEVISASNFAGGIIGHLLNGNLVDAYNGGNVSAVTESGTIIGYKEGGSVSRSYYDINRLANHTPATGIKPVRAIGNIADTGTVKGLYRGQMAGAYSIGTKNGQMNFANPHSFTPTPSRDQWSFYPQLKVFATSTSEEIKSDSLESVRGLTFIVGSGTFGDPYIINNESDIIALAETVNTGNTYEGVYFKVADGVVEFNFSDDEEGYPFTPIGTPENAFRGYFDGNGANFRIKLITTSNHIAVFGNIGQDGSVAKFSVSGEISGYNYTAAVAAINSGTINNVYNAAKVTGRNYIAGIAALNNGQITNVYNSGEINGNDYTGGIAAYVDGFITNSYNIGVVYGTGNVGTITGFLNTGLVLHSYYDTTILGAYRSYSNRVKPERAVGNSVDSETVKGLAKKFMTGTNATGTDEYQMYFDDTKNNWGVTYNIDGMDNYPQLRIFSRSVNAYTKALSKASTLTTLYTVSYNYNGATENNQIAASNVLYKKHYELNVPKKYGYVFTGWYYVDETYQYIRYTDENGLSINVYGFEKNIELIAQWEIAYHKVYFVDGYDSVVYTTTIRHGDTVSPPAGITPEKAPSLTKVYIFEEWDFDFESLIEGETRIYGRYNELDRWYKVTFLDGNGDFFAEARVEYGDKVTPPAGTPIKDYDEETAYKFASWNFDFDTRIYENLNITPLFDEVNRWYTVQFVNYDGSLIEEQTVEYLRPAFEPSVAPTKPATVDTVFVFAGWDKEFEKVQENLVITAQYTEEERLYEVIFLDGDGKRFDTQYIGYRKAANNPGGIPTKEYLEDKAYRFTGWDKTFDCITENTTVKALFEEIDRYYQVTFANYDGTELKVETVEYLRSATPPDTTPVRDSDPQYEYTFAGWDKDYTRIEGEIIIYATYTASIRYYEVIFLDGDGNVFDSQQIEYATSAAEPLGIPRKAAHDNVAYKFTGWDKDFNNIIEDITINAVFTQIDRYYQVTFVNHDDSEITTYTVEYFTASPEPQNVTREPSEQFIYTFTGWDKDISCITESITVKAQFEPSLRPFTVLFLDGDRKVYDRQTVLYGENASIPAGVPTKSPDDNYAYKFVSWEGTYTNITEDTEIQATFSAVQRYYIVTFYGYDESFILKSEKVEYGHSANPPEVPIPNHPNEAYEYYFTGWNTSFEFVESDLVVKANYSTRMKTFKVTFVNGDETTTQTVNYGAAAVAPTPKKTGNARVTYVFVEWDTDFSSVKSDLVVTAVFDAIYNIFIVTFLNGDNSVLEEVEVGRGETARSTLTPYKAPTDTKVYLFAGWDRSLEDVQSDMTVKPLFAEKDRWYTVVFKDAFDEDYTTQTVEYGRSATAPSVPPVKDRTDKNEYEFTGWDTPFTNVTENLIIRPQYNQKLRSFTVVFIDGDN
ncbi:MAG TPA: InlB B-repeat-containing protein, partial [Clostridia bacterium]|nr:InlB B-repeat-containing protein [Clostridia bacterium]